MRSTPTAADGDPTRRREALRNSEIMPDLCGFVREARRGPSPAFGDLHRYPEDPEVHRTEKGATGAACRSSLSLSAPVPA